MKMRRFPAGLKFPLWVEILLLAALSIRIESAATKSSGLNLSPFLASGQISEARNLSRTGRLPAYKGTEIESYSGYFSLHEDYEANMFFWYFPAMVQDLLAKLRICKFSLILQSSRMATGPPHSSFGWKGVQGRPPCTLSSTKTDRSHSRTQKP